MEGDPAHDTRIESLTRGAPRRSPTVRVLAAFSEHADCNLASLGFATGVDFEKLLTGTGFEAPFGQSPFAFGRGLAFERLVADSGYAATLDLLRETMGFPVEDARIVSLRNVHPKNARGMTLRAHDTKALLRQIVNGDLSAPNLIDGAVLSAEVGGVRANFEADALAARFGGLIHAGEVKSFPVVDGRGDPDKVGAALDQVAIYILLARGLVEELGGNADLVSSDALLITPKNVGLTPTLNVINVARRIARTQTLLDQVPRLADMAVDLPTGASFGLVASQTEDQNRRVAHLHNIADQVGTTYRPTCLATCGLSRVCRARAFNAASPQLVGPEIARLLPGVASLSRAAELSDGAPPSISEAPAAQQLARASRLYERSIRYEAGAS